MSLARTQREFFEVVRTPLSPNENTRRLTVLGRSAHEIANRIVAPNDRLNSLERIQLYNRQYWWRMQAALAEDFPGLRAVVGEKKFWRIANDYLNETGSRSFTLRDLGSQLPQWLIRNASYVRGIEAVAVEIAQLEWAEIEAFDGEDAPALKPQDMEARGSDPIFRLQPFIRLLELSYEVDELLLTIRRKSEGNSYSANSVMKQMRRSRISRAKLPTSRSIYLVVHRHEFSVYFKRVEPEAFILLREFQHGRRLSKAIAKPKWGNVPPEEIADRVRGWFMNWTSLGWFVADVQRDKRKESSL